MANPIKAEELFDIEGFKSASESITKNLHNIKTEYEDIAKTLKANANNISLDDLARKVEVLEKAMTSVKHMTKLQNEARDAYFLGIRRVVEEENAAIKEREEAEKRAHKSKLAEIRAAFAEEKEVEKQLLEEHKQALKEKAAEDKKAAEEAKRIAKEKAEEKKRIEREYEAECKRLIEEEKRIAKEAAEAEKRYKRENKDMLDAETKARKDAHKAMQGQLNAAFKLAEQDSKMAAQQVVDANIQKMLAGNLKATELSYNQLSAMYTKMSAQLKTLSADEIQATQENRALATATKQVRDAMNDAQKAMGNYSLNVGRYHTAFDGLGFSIQQVLREIPSATTVSQFFLAISNNIPMVVDQLKLFKDEQADIKKQLGELKEGTKEYIELQSKQISVGRKVLTSIFNWQTAILAFLLLLRKLPDLFKTIGEMIKGIADKMTKVSAETTIMTQAMESFLSNTSKLDLLIMQLDKITQGTNEWRILINEIKDITNDENIKLDTTKQKILDITKAWKEQQRQLAINSAVQDMYSTNAVNTAKRSAIKKATSYEQIAAILGWTGVEYDKHKGEYDLLTKGSWWTNFIGASGRSAVALLKGNAFGKAILSATPTISDDEMNAIINDLYKVVPSIKPEGEGKPKGGKSAPTYKEIEDRYWELEEKKIQLWNDGYEKEIILAKLAHDKSLEENDIFYDAQVTKLDENLRKELMTQEEYDTQMANVKKEYSDWSVALEEEYRSKLKEIWKKDYQERIKAEIDQYDREYKEAAKADNIKATNIGSEIARNEALRDNILLLEQELKKLIELKRQAGLIPDNDLSIQLISDQILKKQNEIKQKNANMSYSQRLKKGKFSIVDLIAGRASDDKKNALLKGLGFQDFEIENMDKEGSKDENYKQGLEHRIDLIKDWASATIGYIEEVANAWIELAKARVEAAEEETEAAKTEYEYQKSLMDAGYANSMSIAYTEYKEKQALQKQAEEEAQQAQKAQQAIDTATQISSLVTAIANIWANATKAGLLAPAVAGVMTATMIGSFIAAKAMAANVANYGEGGYEVMQGGSHASGHDIDLGVNNRHGKRMHVEGGEGLAVISNKAKRRYGHSAIESVINSINNGTFDPSAGQLTRVSPVVAYQSSSVNLGKVENSLSNIERNSSRQSYVTANGDIIEIEGSLKRTIHK